jgi:hypothetical protein
MAMPGADTFEDLLKAVKRAEKSVDFYGTTSEAGRIAEVSLLWAIGDLVKYVTKQDPVEVSGKERMVSGPDTGSAVSLLFGAASTARIAMTWATFSAERKGLSGRKPHLAGMWSRPRPAALQLPQPPSQIDSTDVAGEVRVRVRVRVTSLAPSACVVAHTKVRCLWGLGCSDRPSTRRKQHRRGDQQRGGRRSRSRGGCGGVFSRRGRGGTRRWHADKACRQRYVPLDVART